MEEETRDIAVNGLFYMTVGQDTVVSFVIDGDDTTVTISPRNSATILERYGMQNISDSSTYNNPSLNDVSEMCWDDNTSEHRLGLTNNENLAKDMMDIDV